MAEDGYEVHEDYEALLVEPIAGFTVSRLLKKVVLDRRSNAKRYPADNDPKNYGLIYRQSLEVAEITIRQVTGLVSQIDPTCLEIELPPAHAGYLYELLRPKTQKGLYLGKPFVPNEAIVSAASFILSIAAVRDIANITREIREATKRL